jgi:hypothetical protein
VDESDSKGRNHDRYCEPQIKEIIIRRRRRKAETTSPRVSREAAGGCSGGGQSREAPGRWGLHRALTEGTP